MDLIHRQRRMEIRKMKQRVSGEFVLAEVIWRYMGMMLDDKAEAPLPWDYYPELFAKEKAEHVNALHNAELESYKERRKGFVEEFNHRRSGE